MRSSRRASGRYIASEKATCRNCTKDIWLIKHDCGIRDRRSQNWIRDCESALRYASLVQMSRLNARVIVGREMIAPNIQGNGLAQLHGFSYEGTNSVSKCMTFTHDDSSICLVFSLRVLVRQLEIRKCIILLTCLQQLLHLMSISRSFWAILLMTIPCVFSSTLADILN